VRPSRGAAFVGQALPLAFALSLLCACAGPESESKPAVVKPVALAPELSGMTVRIHPEGSDIGHEIALALGTELARAGLAVVSDGHQPGTADLRLYLDLRTLGVAVEGVTSLSVESNGILVDRFTTPLDLFRRDTFAAAVARELADAFETSPRVRALAAARHGDPDAGAPQPVTEVSPTVVAALPPTDASVAASPAGGVSPVAPLPAPTPPAYPPSPTGVPSPPSPPPTSPTSPTLPTSPSMSPPPAAVSPAHATELLGKSGRFGLGLSLEAELGWAQVFASSSSLAGATAALALQFDLGPHAAFRLPLSFVFAGSGNDEFGQLALAPTFIYRFRSQQDQELVPYLGLALRVGSILAGRHFLGRPVTGVAGPDSCPDSKEHPRGATAAIPDCSFFVSPEPVVGLEWHTSRIFSLDIAASYSFAHFSSSEGLARWVSLLQVYLGPRVSF
jgi:hypothetical protein